MIMQGWLDAKNYCQQNYQDLASIHSDIDHEDAMNACAQRTGANPCNDRFIDGDTCRGSIGCWIGLHEPQNEGQMMWSDGSHIDYSNWFPGEPNDSSGMEDEVELRMGCDGYACFNGRWNDNNGGVGANGAGGGVKQPFLCQGRARNGRNGFAPGGGGGGGGH